MSISLPILNEIRIPIPCMVPWDSMTGDERARHCAECNLTVHNLSAMSSDEAAAFVEANEGACLRFYQRPDGTILTRDCKVQDVPVRTHWFGRLCVAVLSCLGLSIVTGCVPCVQGKPAIKGPQPKSNNAARQAIEQPAAKR